MYRYSDDFSPPAPMTTVNVINPLSGKKIQIIMQIDTGADQTCLPRGCLDYIKGWVIKERPVVLIDDITVKVPSYLASVELNGNCIENKFFVSIAGETGLLGRDMINRFVLRFDGLQMKWRYVIK